MEQYFSAATKDVLAKAQEVSVELRHSEVTTFALFLAQCLLDKHRLSVGAILYKDEADFQRFYTAQRLLLQYYFPDYKPVSPLPFSDELIRVIRQSATEMEKYSHDTILPAHLFLSAAGDAQSVLYKVIQPGGHFYSQLLDCYQETGVIPGNATITPEPIKQKGWFSRLFSMPPDTGRSTSFVPLKIGLLKGFSDDPVSRYDTDTDFEKTVVEVGGISHSREQPGSYAILFKEQEGERLVPVLAGGYEAEQLFIALERPDECSGLVLGVLNEVINRLGYRVQESIVYGRKSSVFLTRIILTDDKGLLAIEARPSDAVTLSVISNTPFTFAKMVFDKVSYLPGTSESDGNNETYSE